MFNTTQHAAKQGHMLWQVTQILPHLVCKVRTIVLKTNLFQAYFLHLGLVFYSFNRRSSSKSMR